LGRDLEVGFKEAGESAEDKEQNRWVYEILHVEVSELGLEPIALL
jgi:hypothetical protein